FTEMLNNVIDHSESKSVFIRISYSYTEVEIRIIDKGVGIFRKIKNYLNLENDLHAVLELSKGKLTTDPESHTGEGIFFTSRVFDNFQLSSKDIIFVHFPDGKDYAAEIKSSNGNNNPGTTVIMRIIPKSKMKLQSIFDKFASDDGNYGFSRTIVPVFLAQYGEENLISRSQAKRLLTRFDLFKEVILNFRGVNVIGQAFADEVFRVFVNKNPKIRLTYSNANDQVEKMILRAKGHSVNK
ncbi:hypothetical protein B6I21_01315, partial [candidate division KSB1 bacterium 4572_119]